MENMQEEDPDGSGKDSMSILRWLIGKSRMLFMFCPECNSSAPRSYDCQICHNNRCQHTEKSGYIKKLWWSRYVEKHTLYKNRTFATPIENGIELEQLKRDGGGVAKR